MPRPRFYLIEDDAVSFRSVISPRKTVTTRVRAWAAEGQAPVVLVSDLPGELSPDHASVKFAMLGMRLGGYHTRGFHYFEFIDGKLWSVVFDLIGCRLRPMLARPTYNHAPLGVLSNLIGAKAPADLIERIEAIDDDCCGV